jgi:hypothetical protein
MSIDETLDQQITGTQPEGKVPDDGVAAGQRYDDGARSFAASPGRVEYAAASARVAVNGPEAASLRAAEEQGKAPAVVTFADRLRGRIRRALHRLARAIDRSGSAGHEHPGG